VTKPNGREQEWEPDPAKPRHSPTLTDVEPHYH
jgi:hypothetical protein